MIIRIPAPPGMTPWSADALATAQAVAMGYTGARFVGQASVPGASRTFIYSAE